jgi:hypothetical protein
LRECWCTDNAGITGCEQMNNTRLQDFVTHTTAKDRITFGDVRRLQRDYLPGGVPSCEQAEMLLHLDGQITLTDRAWTDWLVAVIVGFAVANRWPRDAGKSEAVAWLKGALADNGTSTRAGRRIMRELRHQATRIQLIASSPAENDMPVSVARVSDPVEGNATELQLAA